MSDFASLPKELQGYLLSSAADGTGGLAAEFVLALLSKARKHVRDSFMPSPQQQALSSAVAAAFAAALDQWVLTDDETAHYRDLFRTWLLKPDVLTEFRELLSPTETSRLDLDFLREEFKATGLSAEHLGKVSFDVLMRDMMQAFYDAAAEEPLLQEPLKIGVLLQMLERMGLLKNLVEIGRLQLQEQRTSTQLLQELLFFLANAKHDIGAAAILIFRQIVGALSNAGLPLEVTDQLPHLTTPLQDPELLRLVQIELAGLRIQISEDQTLRTAAQLATIERHYRQALIDQFDKLTFRGLSPTTLIALPLEHIYVELKAVADIPTDADTYSAEERRLLVEAEERGGDVRAAHALHLDALHADRLKQRERDQQSPRPRRSIQEILADPLQRGLVILGDPGSGKTTLLHYQALRAARTPRPTDGATAPLPIFVPLAAYDDYLSHQPADRSLGHFLAVYYDQWQSFPGLAPLFQEAFDTGRALVLLDGLDEVIDTDTRLFIAGQISALMRRWAPRGNRFAMTSRIIGYRDAPLAGNLPHVTVVDFGPREIEIFVHQWCRSYEQWVAGTDSLVTTQTAAAEEAALLADIRSNPSVERLAASPLLITMLALLRRQVGKLPDRRILLYERYTNTLIDNWHLFRSVSARSSHPDRLDAQKVVDYLIHLALWLQRNTPSGTARRHDLTTVLQEIVLKSDGHDPITAPVEAKGKAEHTAKRFLDEMRQFAGILIERGRDAFGFLHLTFQEYFCGRALARLDLEEGWQMMRPLLHHPRWREPILLCAGQLGVQEKRQDWVTTLGTRMLAAPSPHEAILHRDLFLATALAADDVDLSAAFHEQLATQLASVVHSLVPTVRDTALAGLAQLCCLHCPTAENFLIQFLSDDNVWQPTLIAMGKVLDAEAARPLHPYLTAKLDDAYYNVRQAAVQALAPLVTTDPTLRSRLTAILGDAYYPVRQAAVRALAPLVTTDPTLRSRLTATLNDAHYYVRQAAVRALAPLVTTDPTLRSRLTAILDDAHYYVRQAAVRALAPLVTTDPTLRSRLTATLDDTDNAVRQAAMQALAPLVSTDPALRIRLTATLDGADNAVRWAAVQALAPLVTTDPALRSRLTAMLDDADDDVRQAAVQALAPLVTTDPALRSRLTATLDDEHYNVRLATVEACLPLLADNEALAQQLLPWLGAEGEEYEKFLVYEEYKVNEYRRRVRQTLAATYATLVQNNTALLDRITDMLSAHAWPIREGAAWTVMAMPGGPPSHLLPVLYGLLEDTRSEDRWPERLQVCEILLNGHDYALSQRAIDLTLAALDYATQPWYDLPRKGAQVREQAARILGQLDPLYQDEKIFTRLAWVLAEDTNEQVRDAAYGALWRLAAAPTQPGNGIE